MREHTLQAQPYQGDHHEKAWGHELWIINDEKYCGKLLVFKKDKQFSMHYHLLKDEAWYVSKGQFAWVVDSKDEAKLITTMKKASRLMIVGITEKDDQTTDHYSMMGFTKAYNTAKKSCS